MYDGRMRPHSPYKKGTTQYINSIVNMNVDMRNNEDSHCANYTTGLTSTNCNLDNSRSDNCRGNTIKGSKDIDEGYESNLTNARK